MKSAQKLFMVLEALCMHGDAGVTELSLKLGLGKSAIHRFLSALVKLGYVRKNSDNGKYYATLRVFQIGAMVRGRLRLVNLARPYMEELGRETHETINLGLFEEGEVVYIDKVESVETLRIDLAVGRRVPAYCTALGKVFLANLPEEDLEAYLSRQNLRTLTKNTITSAGELRNGLEQVKADGFAIDNGELDEGIKCIAAPIRDESGRVIAAISIAGPKARMTERRLHSFKRLLLSGGIGPNIFGIEAGIGEPVGHQQERKTENLN